MPFFKKKKPPQISPERLRRSIPIANPSIRYEEDAKGVVTILIPVATSGSKQAERTARIKLDVIGSKVWKKIDGKTSLNEMVQWMKKEFMLTEREAEVSLSMFMKNLVEKKLVALALPPPTLGTPEVKEEIERIKVEIEELGKAYRKKKVDEKTYNELKEKYEKTIEELQEAETSGKSSNKT